MEMVRGDRRQWEAKGKGHRSGGVMFKTLFEGQPGPGNYWFTLVRIDDYKTPAHRHNFDQVRLMLDGGFNFGPLDQAEGTVGYFTAGVEYAQRSIGPNVHLLLQSEGADGARYLSAREIEAATEELKQDGTFADGTFHPQSGAPAKDGFEAVWEHAVGRPVDYVAARYNAPIIMEPASHAYRPVPGQPGVARKSIGRFSESDLGLSYTLVGAGSEVVFAPARALRLLFVLRGGGSVSDSGDTWGTDAAFRLRSGEGLTLVADENSEIFEIDLPAENFVAGSPAEAAA